MVADNKVPTESVIRALSQFSILPSLSTRPAALVTPIRVPILSNSSTMVKVKMIEIKP